MNEFIEQFILESRELVEQASAALLSLEQSPRDAECIDAAFRAIHTLKGGAAIVDFTDMERAVHAAEDELSAVRSGKRQVTATLIADCFACLDQVARWLDRMETSGELPLGAAVEADRLIARMAGASVAVNPVERDQDWFEAAAKRTDGARSQATTVVRYAPHSASFFRGEDPLALVASLPGLVAIEVSPVDRWPSLGELDPYQCMLVVTAFSAASADEVSAHFQEHAGECEIRSLVAAGTDGAPGTLADSARKLLEAQVALIAESQTATFAGRVASAGLVASNVLRSCAQATNADLIASATERSLAEVDARYLREQIAQVLSWAAPAPANQGSSSAASTSASLLAANNAEPSAQPEVARSLRVDAERVDALVRLTGELTVVKNAIGHVLQLAEANAANSVATLAGLLRTHHGELDHLVGELQRAVLGIRVLPLRTVLQRLPRLVREISASLDKPVKLLIEGDDTEADKAIVEMLFEPLLHIVRNAMDHGIEAAAVRRERNKPATATMRIRASRHGSHVLVEVEDDGGGVDVARVRAVAKERAVASAEMLDAMTEAELVGLVFAAGFSTAAKVTGLSGRGVGMDAVRTAVERVGGRVTMESRAGHGATVKLLLPFSVMMTHVMTVEAGGQMFGIPLDAVVETISVPADSIVGVGAGQAIVRRNRTVAVFELAGLLQVSTQRREQTDAVIVIAAIAGQLGGLRVDRLGERMEVMLKPLDGLLTELPGIAGTTILGDGRVLLVLDLAEVLQ